MSKKNLPYDGLIRSIFGEEWQELPSHELNGVWGVAIVRSILDGVCINSQPSWMLKQIANHLDKEPDELRDAFMRLSMNGVFLRNRIYKDRKALNNNDIHAWCYYAGIASGATGNVIWHSRKKRPKSTEQDSSEGT